ncbi:U2_small nuclear ribonucleoprotein A' putative [Hexamita inflata]|uniref:Leucine-rich repeat-containing protein 51 n=1 Tax=Hexamita inflata TaxID=28002 RepID=A0AA86P704_9EUKA|nr:U2 small nuclear ribonucleoprotein A' putative [Hexamita inflata]
MYQQCLAKQKHINLNNYKNFSLRKVKHNQSYVQAVKQCSDNVQSECCWTGKTSNLQKQIYCRFTSLPLQSINGIEQLQTLKILYLHGNDIQSVADLLPLKQMNLDALTVHGNPLVRQHNYKLFIINQLASLKRLDFGGITKRDRLEAAEAQKMNLISLVVNENVDIGRK